MGDGPSNAAKRVFQELVKRGSIGEEANKRDLEWLKSEVDELHIEGNMDLEYVSGYISAKIDILDLIGGMAPKVPKDVGEWLDDNVDRYKTVYSFIIATIEVFGDTVPEHVWTFATNNPDKMAKAYLLGYKKEGQDD